MSFRKDFIWGAASAAYQVEGAYLEDGKGLGIWDTTIRKKGRVEHNETGDTACDHYHRYKEDIANIKKVGIKYYRFSISWPRVLPKGTGAANPAGLKFYSDLVDELLANDITPMITLYHWNYPDDLYQKGGWLNDQSSDWFAEYVQLVVDNLSDRVQYWMTFNEPQVFVGMGYQRGVHAPFVKYYNEQLIRMTHNILIAHGKAVKIIRESSKLKPIIGMAPSCESYIPLNDSEKAISEAREKTLAIKEHNFILSIRWWLDPVFFGEYPKECYEIFGDKMPIIKEGDMELISQPLDFCGFNAYQVSISNPLVGSYDDNAYQGSPRTALGWNITPEVLYWSSKFLFERYKKPILITENGMAGMDWVHLDGKVHDIYRIDFMHRYLLELKRSAEDGIDIIGYIYWSIMDNFEWAAGYDKRFGLIYVDYRNQKRIIKDSGYWYKTVIDSNGEIL